jgi:hypothetical protein
VRSKAGHEAVVSSKAGEEARCAPGPGSRMAGGGGVALSGATKEREHLVVSKNC